MCNNSAIQCNVIIPLLPQADYNYGVTFTQKERLILKRKLNKKLIRKDRYFLFKFDVE